MIDQMTASGRKPATWLEVKEKGTTAPDTPRTTMEQQEKRLRELVEKSAKEQDNRRMEKFEKLLDRLKSDEPKRKTAKKTGASGRGGGQAPPINFGFGSEDEEEEEEQDPNHVPEDLDFATQSPEQRLIIMDRLLNTLWTAYSVVNDAIDQDRTCLLYTSPSPRDS